MIIWLAVLVIDMTFWHCFCGNKSVHRFMVEVRPVIQPLGENMEIQNLGGMRSVGGSLGASSTGRQYSDPTIAGLAGDMANRQSINRDGEALLREAFKALEKGDLSVKDVMALCAKLREAGMTGKAIDSADESFGPDSMFGKVMSLAEGRSEFDGAFKPNPEKLKEVIDKALGGFPPVSGMAAPINMSGGVSADGSDINY